MNTIILLLLEMEAEIHKVKATFIGSEKSGKTKLITRLTIDSYEENYEATIGIDFIAKTFQINGNDFRI